jgi:predicted unusual protein kinase regulating ubiquinone biosynthesis (AarF/ABC1/UbiB family)
MADIPRKAASRTAKLAAVPLSTAGRTAWGLGKRLGGTPAEIVAAEMQARTAEQVFKVLGELKGGAMKFGQIMSIFEAALPEEVATPYRATLTKLQDAAPPMPAETVHEVLADDLGHDWPQISRLGRTFGSLIPGVDVKPILAELNDRLIEELDYRLEAEAQDAFAVAYDGDPEFAVPAVVQGAEHVIVSEWMDGRPLSDVIATGTREERDRVGLLYVRFLFSGPARVGMLHADPHPGNYRLTKDGRLCVLDYGAAARLPGGLSPSIGQLMRLALAGDAEQMLRGLREEGFVKPHVHVDPQELHDYLAPFIEPAATEEFQFSRDWMREQFARVNDPRRENYSIALKLNLPPSYLLIHRVWLAGIGVLCKLDTHAPFRAEMQAWLPGFAEENSGDSGF